MGDPEPLHEMEVEIMRLEQANRELRNERDEARAALLELEGLIADAAAVVRRVASGALDF